MSRRLLWIPMKNSLNFYIHYFKFKLTAGAFFNLINVFFSTCLYYMLCFTHIGSFKFQMRIQLWINPSVHSRSFETPYFYAAYFMNLINLLISALHFTLWKKTLWIFATKYGVSCDRKFGTDCTCEHITVLFLFLTVVCFYFSMADLSVGGKVNEH